MEKPPVVVVVGGAPVGAMQANGPTLPPGVMMGGAGGALTGGGNNEEISLRPARNFTVLKPNTPSMLPKSAQINVHSHTPPVSTPPSPKAKKYQPISVLDVSCEKFSPDKQNSRSYTPVTHCQ